MQVIDMSNPSPQMMLTYFEIRKKISEIGAGKLFTTYKGRTYKMHVSNKTEWVEGAENLKHITDEHFYSMFGRVSKKILNLNEPLYIPILPEAAKLIEMILDADAQEIRQVMDMFIGELLISACIGDHELKGIGEDATAHAQFMNDYFCLISTLKITDSPTCSAKFKQTLKVLH